MRRRRLLVSALVLACSWLLAFLSGIANRIGLGPNLALLRAASRAERLPKIVPMPTMGLEARAPAGTSCRVMFGTHCATPRWRRLAWSLCPVVGPASPYARTPRTETCHPNDEEEGIEHDVWSQKEIGRVTVAHQMHRTPLCSVEAEAAPLVADCVDRAFGKSPDAEQLRRVERLSAKGRTVLPEHGPENLAQEMPSRGGLPHLACPYVVSENGSRIGLEAGVFEQIRAEGFALLVARHESVAA
jgi:hypothetical protein